MRGLANADAGTLIAAAAGFTVAGGGRGAAAAAAALLDGGGNIARSPDTGRFAVRVAGTGTGVASEVGLVWGGAVAAANLAFFALFELFFFRVILGTGRANSDVGAASGSHDPPLSLPNENVKHA